uniref:Putative DNA binding, helix-turn-helix domain containing protein n=1 Tax=viral metagenome TaxID=1070528 RepID=A0A6M3IF91_9ZZZZ
MGRSSVHKRPEMKKREIERDLPVLDEETTKRFSKVYVSQAARLAAAGFSNADLCYTFGVDKFKLIEWRKQYPELDRAIKEGKKHELKRLLAKCYLAAEGYRYKTRKKTVTKSADGSIKSVKEEEFENFQTPDNTMLVFLICNLTRQLGLDDADAWLSKQRLEIESKNLTVSVSSDDITNQIARLAGNLLTNQSETIKKIESKTINEH